MAYEYPVKPVKAILVRRYKRFLVDVRLEDGRIVTAHCTNTGSLKSCLIPGAPVLLTPANSSRRKTPYTWESIYIDGGWVGVNTTVPNKLVFNAVQNRMLKEFQDFHTVKSEVKFGDSRFDLYMESDNQKLFAEIKNVTYKHGNAALFPDAPTERGRKHLKALMRAVEKGYRAAMIYVIPRTDVTCFDTADDIDPQYAALLRQARAKGVEIYAYRVMFDEKGARIKDLIPFCKE